jgi:hypothetical protein
MTDGLRANDQKSHSPAGNAVWRRSNCVRSRYVARANAEGLAISAWRVRTWLFLGTPPSRETAASSRQKQNFIELARSAPSFGAQLLINAVTGLRDFDALTSAYRD